MHAPTGHMHTTQATQENEIPRDPKLTRRLPLSGYRRTRGAHTFICAAILHTLQMGRYREPAVNHLSLFHHEVQTFRFSLCFGAVRWQTNRKGIFAGRPPAFASDGPEFTATIVGILTVRPGECPSPGSLRCNRTTENGPPHDFASPDHSIKTGHIRAKTREALSPTG